MASLLNVSSPSIFPLSSALPLQPVGRKNPIEIPCVKIQEIGRTIGKQIAQGGSGSVYSVRDSQPPRVYKFVPLDAFQNGDEIRICQVAAQAGIAPSFYGACLVQQRETSFVLLEMDDAGKTLSRWMEDLAIEPDVDQAALIEESSTQKALDKAMKELEEKKNANDESDYTAVLCDSIEKLSMEEAIDRLYPSHETFFFELFSSYKKLAEQQIAYTDANCGNLIPNRGKGFQLIDFDLAFLEKSPAAAAAKTLRSASNQMHFHSFTRLKNLSEESQELIQWFREQSFQAFLETLS